MKLKHTPGPWIYESGNLPQYNVISSEQYICNTLADNDQSNARLIAAAPEMLEALIKILKTEGSIESINNMISIIERATGLKIEEVLECTE